MGIYTLIVTAICGGISVVVWDWIWRCLRFYWECDGVGWVMVEITHCAFYVHTWF